MMPMEIAIRLATAADADAIHAIHTRAVRGACAPAYEARVIEGWLKGREAARSLPAIEAGRMFAAEPGRAVAGFCEFVPGEIIALFVDPANAGAGVGSAATV